jgi:hypothetical protein
MSLIGVVGKLTKWDFFSVKTAYTAVQNSSHGEMVLDRNMAKVLKDLWPTTMFRQKLAYLVGDC